MKHIRKLREASAKRTTLAQHATPISDEIAQWYDERRLTEEDVDHLAEIYSEGRTYNRNASLRSTHE
jgi:hypothetical protein